MIRHKSNRSEDAAGEFQPLSRHNLVDERFPLLVKGESLATYSNEMKQLKPTERYKDIAFIEADTTQHYDVWLNGLRRFSDQMHDQGTRVILNKVQFAEKDALGHNFPPNFIRRHNRRLMRMYEAFHSELNCLSIEYHNPFIADPVHRWNRAPFHYVDEVNLEFMSKLDDVFKALC
ncbi:DUF6270 domain-containing protein [Roseovarius sp. A-2]|uniref:DUF6270 domain-containing protein n=1 Tax=Roseovarius sp. A-2 TaxID=1570360 RepID=UPI0027D8AAB4|nr:DUF6270 domain-containing protein [Roseovarius sp. A-2]